MPFYSPSLSQSPPLSFACLFSVCPCVSSFACRQVSPPILIITPEHEIFNFTQREGENLKDAWHRICNAQYKSTRKLSTSILLRNFYVGITPWNRCVLDTVAKGDFMSSHAFDAYNAMLDLFGPPPLLVNGTVLTLEHVMQRLEIIEKKIALLS